MRSKMTAAIVLKQAILFVIAISTAGMLAGCDRTPDSATAGTHAVPFLALGDSYTIGESVDAADRWPNQLAAQLRQRGLDVGEPQIIARTGWTTTELSAAIDAADPRGPFGLVGLLIGVNDQFRGVVPESYRSNFVALLERSIAFVGGDKSHVFILSIPDWGVMPFAMGRDRVTVGRQIDAFNAVARSECERHGVRFIDVTSVSREASTQPTLGAEDGLHPSGTQYARWAALAASAIKP